MIFLSVERSPEWVMKPGAFRIVETAMGPMPDLERGIRVKFTELQDFLETDLLPAKRGRALARGMLDTAPMSEKLGVEESLLIEFLVSRPEYELELIGVNPDGDFQADSDDKYIVPVGDDYFCKLCNNTFKPRARGGHVRTKLHKAALVELEAEGREAMANLELEASQTEEDRLARTMELSKVASEKSV